MRFILIFYTNWGGNSDLEVKYNNGKQRGDDTQVLGEVNCIGSVVPVSHSSTQNIPFADL